MGSKKIINIRHYITLFLSLYSLSYVSASSYTIGLKERETISENAYLIFRNLMNQPEYVWGEVGNIDIYQLLKSDTLYVSLQDEQVELIIKYRNKSDDYHYIHFQSTDNEVHAFASILGKNVHIDFRTSFAKYQIISISATEVAIFRYETDVLNEPDFENTVNENLQYGESSEINSIISSSTPVIRVLFLYTDSALSIMNSPNQEHIKMEAYRYINEANESFLNSNINAHLELAYLGQTNYNESSYSWDNVLNHFSTQGDGYIDDVHALRNKYKADLCVLMVCKSDHCGEARIINANSNTAFCIIWPNYSYCGWRYSAIHEIGHLIGCRHNKSKDNSDSPYMYGHGYVNCDTTTPSASWCTIMSYESSCSTGSNRILYWSNPNIYYNGIATGTATYENNARVWNERANTVSNFRTKDNTILLTSYQNNTIALFESYEATSTIITGLGYEVQSGQMVDMAAATEIRLTSNTHIKSGSNFRASIRTNADNSNYPQFIGSKHTNNADLSHHVNLSIVPCPAKSIITITSQKQLDNIRIYTITGQCVLRTKQTNINVSELSSGIYIVTANTTDGNTLQSKFVKM